MDNFEIQCGVVTAINEKQDERGNRLVTVDVQSFEDLSTIKDVAIDSPLFAQYIPVVGQIVMIQKVGNYFAKVMGYFGSRVFQAPIQPGEALIEGHGGGFMFLNNGGDVVIADEVLGNVIRLINMVGVTITANAMSINVKGIGQINVTPEDSELGTKNQIELVKIAANGDKINLTMTDEKVMIDSPKVEVGLRSNVFEAGAVVSTSQVFGTHSICPITGMPIPRAKNSTVRLSPTDHAIIPIPAPSIDTPEPTT